MGIFILSRNPIHENNYGNCIMKKGRIWLKVKPYLTARGLRKILFPCKMKWLSSRTPNME